MASARVAALASVVVAGSAASACAQPAWPGGAPAGPAGPPQHVPWPAGAPLWPSQAQDTWCVARFTALRWEVEKLGMAARAGAEKRLSRAEMCKLVTAYATVQTRWVSYAERNMTKCGIPEHIVNQMKTFPLRSLPRVSGR
jgi:hypothetical protein